MRQPRFAVLWFLVFTYALTVVGQGVHLWVVRRLTEGVPAGIPIENTPSRAWMPYGFYITNAGPSLVGLLMTFYLYGLPGVRRLAIQLTPWPVGRAWPVVAICLLLPLGVIVVPFKILVALGMSDSILSWQLSSYLYSAIVSEGLIGPGLCEEIGWRGFALPHLQRRYSALVGSMIIGLAWALWHWPNFVIPSDPPPWWQFVALVPMSMAVSVLYTWVYNSTGGSIFAVVMLHGATVASSSVSPSPDSAVAARLGVIVLLLYAIIPIGLLWRYGATNLSWRGRVVADSPPQELPPEVTWR
jgi:membrane protease YdiL (CAAX protease family)